MNHRIRTIKPEWRTDRRLHEAGLAARVLSVCLITMSDDEGRGHFREAVLAAECFEHVENPSRTFREAFAKLSGWFLTVYEVRGERYWQVCNWSKHQKIDKPRPSRLPPPSDGENANDSAVREPFANDSRNSRESVAPGPGTRDQGSGTRDQGPTLAPDEPGPGDADAPPVSVRVSELEARYPADLVAEARAGCALSRKSNKMSDTVWLATLERLAKLPADAVVAAMRAFVERHADGDKGEAYLEAIARREAKGLRVKRLAPAQISAESSARSLSMFDEMYPPLPDEVAHG